jgi:hypothetical protein
LSELQKISNELATSPGYRRSGRAGAFPARQIFVTLKEGIPNDQYSRTKWQ